MKYLTEEKLDEVLAYILNYQMENGRSPSYREIGEACNISSKSSVTKVLNKLYDNGKLKNEECELRRFISTPSNLSLSENKVVNVINNKVYGSSILNQRNIKSTLSLPNIIFGDYDKFMVIAKDDSMINLGIREGNILVVQKTNKANAGQIVIARVNSNEIIVRTLEKDNQTNELYLKSESNVKDNNGSFKYSNIYLKDGIQIFGVVKFVINQIE